MSGWRRKKVAELIDEISMGPFGSNIKVDCFVEQGIPVLNGSNLEGFRLNDDSFRYVTREKAESLGRANARRGDVVVTHRGTLGQIVFIPANSKFDRYVISQSQFRLRCSEFMSPEFFVYYFHSGEGQAQLLSNASQVGVPALAQATTTFRNLTVPCPPLAMQRRIAAVLSALDDKIELNNRINANLETQAQALFRSWFVDFEPWGGTMPEGWREGKLEEMGKIVGGGTPSKTNAAFFASKGIAWLTPKDLSIDKSKFRQHGEQDITPLGLSASSAQLMPKGTVLFSSRAPIGYIAIATGEVSTNQGFKSVIPNKESATPFIYYWLKSNVDEIEARASGSTFPEISGAGMKNLPVLVPGDEVLDGFAHICDPLFAKQWSLEKENRALAAIRDTLLPKLMSGEIDVSQVEIPA